MHYQQLIRTVSIHAPAWGATCTQVSNFSLMSRFNSRSRMGSDLASARFMDEQAVSIHAPAWGATRGEAKDEAMFNVSIHAPAWGATQAKPTMSPALDRFNSRSRMGSDVVDDAPESEVQVSIHAPAWGATSQARTNRSKAKFQFTLPHGERQELVGRVFQLFAFQFTLPHGERPRTTAPQARS